MNACRDLQKVDSIYGVKDGDMGARPTSEVFFRG